MSVCVCVYMCVFECVSECVCVLVKVFVCVCVCVCVMTSHLHAIPSNEAHLFSSFHCSSSDVLSLLKGQFAQKMNHPMIYSPFFLSVGGGGFE